MGKKEVERAAPSSVAARNHASKTGSTVEQVTEDTEDSTMIMSRHSTSNTTFSAPSTTPTIMSDRESTKPNHSSPTSDDDIPMQGSKDGTTTTTNYKDDPAPWELGEEEEEDTNTTTPPASIESVARLPIAHPEGDHNFIESSSSSSSSSRSSSNSDDDNNNQKMDHHRLGNVVSELKSSKTVSFMEDVNLLAPSEDEEKDSDAKDHDISSSLSYVARVLDVVEGGGGGGSSSRDRLLSDHTTATGSSLGTTTSHHRYRVLERHMSSMDAMGHATRQRHGLMRALHLPCPRTPSSSLHMLVDSDDDEDDIEHGQLQVPEQRPLQQEEEEEEEAMAATTSSDGLLVDNRQELDLVQPALGPSLRGALMASTGVARRSIGSSHHHHHHHRDELMTRFQSISSGGKSGTVATDSSRPPKQYTLRCRRGQEQFAYFRLFQKFGMHVEWDDINSTTRLTCCSLSFEQLVIDYLHWCFRSALVAVILSAFVVFLALTLLFAVPIWSIGHKHPKCIGGVDFATDYFTDAFALSWTTFSTVRGWNRNKNQPNIWIPYSLVVGFLALVVG